MRNFGLASRLLGRSTVLGCSLLQLALAGCIAGDDSSVRSAVAEAREPLARAPDSCASPRAAIDTDLARSPADLRVVRREDTLEQIRVERGFRHAVLLVRAEDGGWVRRCVHDAREAHRLLDHGAR